ncbi:MAG: Crp/Fnr family transcriptional regulator [Granulosicoccus sp.]
MSHFTEIKSLPGQATLRQFDIFRELTAAERDDVGALMRLRRYSANTYVISAETDCRDVYFILSGRIRTCSISANGKQINYADLSSGEMFGEFAAIDQQGRSADCQVVQESMLASISGKCFLNVLDRYPVVKDAVMRRVVSIVRKQMERVSEFTFYNVNQRVRFELIRLGNEAAFGDDVVRLESVPTHCEIAQKIGTHREAVTRELSSLQSKGLITWNRNEHVIHDLDELASYAHK